MWKANGLAGVALAMLTVTLGAPEEASAFFEAKGNWKLIYTKTYPKKGRDVIKKLPKTDSQQFDVGFGWKCRVPAEIVGATKDRYMLCTRNPEGGLVRADATCPSIAAMGTGRFSYIQIHLINVDKNKNMVGQVTVGLVCE